jgi:hypothetical protein
MVLTRVGAMRSSLVRAIGLMRVGASTDKREIARTDNRQSPIAPTTVRTIAPTAVQHDRTPDDSYHRLSIGFAGSAVMLTIAQW